jgi:hypothetical protein
MTQRFRLCLGLLAFCTLLTGTAVAAAPPAAPVATQEVLTIQRTAKTGLAALALIGKVEAKGVPGFLATVDRWTSGAYSSQLGTFVDFNEVGGLTKYGHGSAVPLCNNDLVCSIDPKDGSLTFTITETSDADNKDDSWAGLTRYVAIRGTKIDIQVAAIGFTVKRHTAATFERVTREQADADGVGALGSGAELFQAAQLSGGPRGSFAALQLPCDISGAGAVTFASTGDQIPALANCSPTDGSALDDSVSVATVGVTRYGGRAGLYSREASAGTAWQVSGAVSGLSNYITRLFVLNY